MRAFAVMLGSLLVVGCGPSQADLDALIQRSQPCSETDRCVLVFVCPCGHEAVNAVHADEVEAMAQQMDACDQKLPCPGPGPQSAACVDGVCQAQP